MAKLSFIDRMKLVYSVVFIILGIIIIYEYATVARASHWLVLAMGLVFVAFGVYRLSQFRQALGGGGK